MKIKGWKLSTYEYPEFIVVAWEHNFPMVKCSGFDALGRWSVINVTREDFNKAKYQSFELAGVKP